MENPIIYLVEHLLGLNKIKFDKEELSFQIQSHPSFPSLHSITGVLDHFGIDNLTLDVPTTTDVFDQLPNSFLAQVSIDDVKELILVEKKGNRVKGVFSLKKKVDYNIDEFLEKFTGIIVAIEKNDDVLTSENKNSKTLNIVLTASFLACLLGLVIFSMPGLSKIAFVLFSVFGIFTSIAIIKENLGMQSSLGETLCATKNVKTDCTKVITSKGATVFGVINISDISIVYFSAITITSLFLMVSTNLSHVYALSVLGVPVVLFSVYYQYFKVKAWCPLCLIIAGILMLQAIIGVVNISEVLDSNINMMSMTIMIAAFLMTTLIWNTLVIQIVKFIALKQDKIDYFKFKRNYDLFKMVLEKSPRISTEITNTNEIVFGNRDAKLSIVVVTSPFCGHCKPVHNHIAEILKIHKNDVSITIRFSVNTKNTETDLYKITTRLIEIYHTQGQDNCLQAMHDIYGEMDNAAWFSIWGTAERSIIYAETIEAQNAWCTNNGINFTPEILVKGRSFPKEYQRQDLKLFIEDLAEDCQETLLVPVLI